MSLVSLLNKAMSKSNGEAVMTKVPVNRKPNADSLKRFESEVTAQVSSNDAMRSRSMQNAANTMKR